MKNFNIDPYYDDFDPSRNFHRILFKPGYAVQARELTQAQTILQDQISKFADNIFKQNTPITGGKVTTNLNAYYVRLNTQYNGQNIVAQDFINRVITDSTGTIIAKVIKTAEGTGTGTVAGDPPTLILSYLSGLHFTDGDVIVTIDGSNFGATIATSTTNAPSTGKSSVASISDGVFYVINGYSQSSIENQDGSYTKYSIGNFVSVQPQTIILDKYSDTPTYRIGLSITESIVDYINEPSLLDPAIGASNYQAPGADRYQITLTLTTLPLTVGNDDAFIELVRIDQGNVVKQVDGTVYAVIDDYFAKRDYETNGDYVVDEFKLTPSANTLYTSKYDLDIGKGVAYVHGYRIENQSNLTLTSDRAQSTNSIDGNVVYIDYGSYLYVDTVTGAFDVTTMPAVDFHCVSASNIVSSNVKNYTSTLVGTGYIRNLNYDNNPSGDDANTTAYVYKAYVCDILTNTLSGNAASGTTNTITFDNTSHIFSGSANAYYGATITITGGTSFGDSRKIVSYNGTTRVATVDQPFSVVPDSTSAFNISFTIGTIDSIVKANSTYAVLSSANVNAQSRVRGIETNDTQLQNAGYPEMLFNIGYPYVGSIDNSDYTSTKVFRSKTFSNVGGTPTITITIPVGTPLKFLGTGTLHSDTIKQNYTAIDRATGEVLDLCTTGNTVTIASNSTTATITSTAYNGKTVDIITTVAVANADYQTSGHVLKIKNIVSGNTTDPIADSSGTVINTNTYVDTAEGQVYIKNAGLTRNKMSLYVTDVKKIKKIIDTRSPTVAPTAAMMSDSTYDITTSFKLDNGQRDNMYDHASIQLVPGVSMPAGNILVVFDYYAHSGGDGYFSVMSYLAPLSSSPEPTIATIPSYVSTHGTTYNLEDSLDFRPSRKNVVTTYTFETTGNPSVDDTGILIPANLSQYQHNYSYYLGRKDKLILTKDQSFNIIKGTPSTNPTLPKEPDGSLVLAELSLDPYTAYVPGEAPPGTTPNLSVNKILHKRWAKSDITDMQTQLNNLEYYSALNMLEQKASSLQVPDVNGLNRFKNGILVDDFSSYSTADTYNPDYAVNINTRKKHLSPLTVVDNFQLQNPTVLASLGTLPNTASYSVKSINGTQTNIFTLPYTTMNVVTQQLASNTISVNPFNVVVQQGVGYLNPPMDNWVDNKQAPAILVVDPGMQVYQETNGVNLTNTGDFASIAGTTAVNSTSVRSGRTVTVTTSTYSDTLTNTSTTPGYSPISSTYATSNGYLTNVAQLPYIRAQQIIVKSKGLLVNTPVSCWFDGKDVSKYMTTPNTIELTNVAGEFLENDIVGFYVDATGAFYPIARVVSVYKYPNSTRVRLYVATLIGAPGGLTTNTLRNAHFDGSGNYIVYTSDSKTANGTISADATISLSVSGNITGAGGTYTISGNNIPTNMYKTITNVNYNTFLNQYGMWGTGLAKTPANQHWQPTFIIENLPAGTYTIKTSAYTTANVRANGAIVANVAVNNWQKTKSPTVNTATFAAGTITLTVDAVTTGGPAAFAMTIENSRGQSVFATTNPPGLNRANVASEVTMPLGGAWFEGVTSVLLDQNASPVDDYYTGAKINITSNYITSYSVANGGSTNVKLKNTTALSNNTVSGLETGILKPQSTIYTYSATIIGYNGTTKLAQLDTPVRISLGQNDTYGMISSKYSIVGTQSNITKSIIAGKPATLSTDESGNFTAIFNLPCDENTLRFQTGQRVFRVDNRTVPNDPTSATSYTEATFTASGLSTTSQKINFGASVDASGTTFTQVNQTDNQLLKTIVKKYKVDPVAQTFIIDKDNYPNGLFLSSVKLFFYSKPSTDIPIKLSIVGTLNGYPKGKTLDHSTVMLNSDKVKTSKTPHYLDSSTYTEFVFEAPVYVEPGVLYAMMIEASSEEYQLYFAQQNTIAVPSTAKEKPTDANPTLPSKIGSVPYVGALFESQNAITWTADQTKQLMFVINRCVFDTGVTATIPFIIPKNLPYRKLGTEDIQYSLDPDSTTNLYGNFSDNMDVNALNLTTTDFLPSQTNIDYAYQAVIKNGSVPDSTKSINPGKYGSPTADNVYLDDGLGPRVLLKDKAAAFTMYATLSSSDPTVSPVISDDATSLYNIRYIINNMGIDTGVINLTDGGLGYNVSNTQIIVSNPDIGSDAAVFGITANANGAITRVYTTYSGSGYITTPTISLYDPNATANAVVTISGETSPNGGTSYAKYFTKKVILTPANDSGDLRVFYTAYKPIGTNIFIYYKILNRNDTQPFEDGNWQLMTQVGNQNVYSTSRDNLIEFECAPGVYGSGQADNFISYTSENGTTYTTFSQFAIKVVLATSDNTNIPFLSDIRALALPSGTGI